MHQPNLYQGELKETGQKNRTAYKSHQQGTGFLSARESFIFGTPVYR
jgi:hypothetical protein